jgi:intron-binding protein aquarius
VTHSNSALNDLFEKIMERDIPERYLVRLGRGQEHLSTTKDFSKFGRVRHMLARRDTLLADVQRLATSLQAVGAVANTCATALTFHKHVVVKRWQQFLQIAQQFDTVEAVANVFPFSAFFEKDAETVFVGCTTVAECIVIAEKFQARLELMFLHLKETRPFELLRSFQDRGNFLITKQAKIIAMTCTHAAIKRSELIELGLQYDTLIMEEAAQVMEIETLIPMLLQKPHAQLGNRMKRVVLLGDHNQLPPVIKNAAFQKYSHLDQSLFSRFVRLGVPTIQLDAQARSRPSLAALWKWRYTNLVNLPSVSSAPQYKQANLGFQYDYQLIDVPDYNGAGESSPSRHFTQNLGEAEYVVQTYMYMRLMGYPANKISIITTYNGQKALIQDVIKARCSSDRLFGRPREVSTVDKFQGQQNDYVLLSLVKTHNVGHIRDVRRLVVALSRARLGLYVFCRAELFQNCYELAAAFSQLSMRPQKLALLPEERPFPATTHNTLRLVDAKVDNHGIQVNDVTSMGQLVLQMQTVARQRWTEYSKRVEAAQLIARQESEAKIARIRERQRGIDQLQQEGLRYERTLLDHAAEEEKFETLGASFNNSNNSQQNKE